jgi:hypothetical protein
MLDRPQSGVGCGSEPASVMLESPLGHPQRGQGGGVIAGLLEHRPGPLDKVFELGQPASVSRCSPVPA